jgi:hypothetical protein
VLQKDIQLLPAMPDLRILPRNKMRWHPETEQSEIALDSPSTLLRVVSLSIHGSSPE